MTKYNGYANYPTWATKLWMDNNSSMYYHFKDFYKYLSKKNLSELDNRFEIEDEIKKLIEENEPELSPSLYSDLFTYAMHQIDYFELAGVVLDDLNFESEEEND